ncbi:heme-binding domain-containing protein [Aquimarina intermedia]|uniref:Heme-binding protein n=1 Tax=Aquimarina intermedia TaxID=350814 RepID=A0A5S5C702_9FLAO|nr:heme-binding domain-containing protein [Aquimarina intermedia]TYP74378.1 heme-binding protein [Aquimarina intermedia]
MKAIKIIAIIIVTALVGIQFIPTERNQIEGNPLTDFRNVYEVPDTIQRRLEVSCYDCHSNNTYYPWYSNLQPIAWFLETHIKEGKSELNFNEWGHYSDRRKKSKLRSIIKQVKNNEMPLESYTFIHGDAVLTTNDKKRLIIYMNKLQDSLE